MTLYECDFCKEQKRCTKLQMNHMEYDICEKCQDKMTKKLEGRGTSRVSLQWGPVVYYYGWPYYNGNWPVVYTPVYTPTWPTITVTTPAQSSGVMYTQMGSFTGSSGNYTLVGQTQ